MDIAQCALFSLVSYTLEFAIFKNLACAHGEIKVFPLISPC